jgi:hypothetical protein
MTLGRTLRLVAIRCALGMGACGDDSDTTTNTGASGASEPQGHVKKKPHRKPVEPRPAEAIATVERYYRLLDPGFGL